MKGPVKPPEPHVRAVSRDPQLGPSQQEAGAYQAADAYNFRPARCYGSPECGGNYYSALGLKIQSDERVSMFRYEIPNAENV